VIVESNYDSLTRVSTNQQTALVCRVMWSKKKRWHARVDDKENNRKWSKSSTTCRTNSLSFKLKSPRRTGWRFSGTWTDRNIESTWWRCRCGSDV